jgi:phosphoribosylamine--glycine ligase
VLCNTDRLEMDRDFGQEEMRAAGITILPRWEFDSFDAAIAFIKANPGRYVVKPSGRAQNEKVLSFVGQEEDGLDVLTMLERYRKGWSSKIKSFQLQKYASGVEVAVGAFFNGTDFLRFSPTSSTNACST